MSDAGSRHGEVRPQDASRSTDARHSTRRDDDTRRSTEARVGRRPSRSGAALLLGLALAAGACGSDADARDPGRFCERVRVLQPVLTDAADPVALVAVYDDLADEAPLQIEEDWGTIVVLLRAVTSYDPTDDDEVQEVLAQALRSQAAIDAVGLWVRDNCGIELGPISETVPIGGTGDALLPDDASDDAASDDASGTEWDDASRTDESDPTGTDSGG